MPATARSVTRAEMGQAEGGCRGGRMLSDLQGSGKASPRGPGGPAGRFRGAPGRRGPRSGDSYAQAPRAECGWRDFGGATGLLPRLSFLPPQAAVQPREM